MMCFYEHNIKCALSIISMITSNFPEPAAWATKIKNIIVII